jgi:hypothetical protein
MEGIAPYLAGGCVAAFLAWATLCAVTVLGRLKYERRLRDEQNGAAAVPRGGAGRRLLAQALAHKGDRGKWRRITALRRLVRGDHPDRRLLLEAALRDPDRDVAGAAVRLLGEIRTAWADRELVRALRQDLYPRSRIAAQLERRTPEIGRRLEPLLRSRDPANRFWAATLLAGCDGVATKRLLELASDGDPNVRAAAIEALGERRDPGALSAALAHLDDEVWFVRVHAIRAVGALGTVQDAPRLAKGLGDPKWWIRAAVKDALRGYGIGVAGAVIPLLEHVDPFVRNGAAEVLQDVGFVDAMASTGREGELLERIMDAGGPSLRAAAKARAERIRSQPGLTGGVGA